MYLLEVRNILGFWKMLINMDLFKDFLQNMKELQGLGLNHGILDMLEKKQQST